jgi:PAS domain S-box-containing protein
LKKSRKHIEGWIARILPGQIRARLFLLVALMLLPLILLMGWSYRQRYENRRDFAIQTELEVAQGIATTFAAFVAGIQQENLAIGYSILALAFNENPQITELLQKAAGDFPTITNLSWVSPEGVVLASSLPEAVGKNLYSRPYFNRILAGAQLSIGNLSLEGAFVKAPTVAIASAIRDEHGLLLGSVVSGIEPTRLGEVTFTQQRPPGGAFAIFDAEGTLVYHSSIKFPTPEVRLHWKETDPVLQRVLKEGQAGADLATLAIPGGKWITARVPIAGIGWVAGAGRQAAVAYAPIRQEMLNDIFIIGPVCLLAFLLASLLSLTIAEPLRRLEQDASAMGSGQIINRFDQDAPLEVRTLRETIVQMTREFSSSSEALRQSEERYRNLFESMSEGFAICDIILDQENRPFDYRHMQVNPAFERMTGFHNGCAIGKTARELVDYVEPYWIETFGEVALSGKAASREDYVQSFDKWYNTRAFSMGNGRFAYLFEDVTERKKTENKLMLAQQELQKAKDELEERVRERTSELEEIRRDVENRNRRLEELSHELKRSRDRYWNLYNWSPLGYLTVDDRLAILEINVAGSELLGAKRTELLGASIKNYLSDENLKQLLDSFQECLKGNHTVTELKLATNGDKQVYVQIHCVPYKGPGGNENQYRTAIIDISKLKETEEKLYRLNRLYSVLSETGKAIVHSCSQTELFSKICRIAVENGGFVKACIGMIDQHSMMIIPAATHGLTTTLINSQCICFRERLDNSGPVATAIREKGYYVSNNCIDDPDSEIMCSQKQTLEIKSMAAFALVVDGKPTGIFNISSSEINFFGPEMIDLLNQMAADISFAMENMEKEKNRRKAEEALRQETIEKLHAVEELRQKEQLLIQQNRLVAMGELLVNISHHWRQPLNVLGLMVQELSLSYMDGSFSKERLESRIGDVMQVILRMSQTIDNFTNMFEPEEGKVCFGLNELAQKTVSLVETGFSAEHIKIDFCAEEEIFVEGFLNEFSQVMITILINARDVLLGRKISAPLITIRICRENGTAVVTISDNGGGIPEGKLPHIFDPYFTTKEPDKGSGLGLYMAKTIIEKSMQGYLKVKNTADGAEFRIEVQCVK